jgi:hypothetical protein
LQPSFDRPWASSLPGFLANGRLTKEVKTGKLNVPFDLKAGGSAYLPQSQLLPQLHSLLSFIGQFLPVFLQFGLSAANAAVQITAIRIEKRRLMCFLTRLILLDGFINASQK